MELSPYGITLWIYNLTLIPIVFFSVLFILLAVLNFFLDRPSRSKFKSQGKVPFVTVQIPTYNDPVAERCIRQCLKFNYPKNRYEIVIADDSTNVETQKTLKKYAQIHPGFVKYIHRPNRKNFKPGALKNSLKICKGEIIVIFDSDWIPNKEFLNEIIKPFSDPKVAIVQSRQDIYNKNTNFITRFATYMMVVYHFIVMPINNRINCVFFCGTAGAIRRSAYEDVGGWNDKSITEDADLTVKLLLKGYKTVYINHETPSETPDTFEGYIKQQMRWCYGNVRVFIDHSYEILFKKGLKLPQRLMITYLTLGNSIAPIVIMMTFFGFAGWFLGEITLFSINDIFDFSVRFLYTSGFLVMGIFALYKKSQVKETPYLILSSLTIGIMTSVANSVAFSRAVMNKKLKWFCTPKIANEKFVEA